MAILSIGFSGTRLGMSDVQKDTLYKLLAKHDGIFHHGDCIGADAEAHDIARVLGWTIHIHPPIDSRLRAFKNGNSSSQPKDYHARNRDIVDGCQYLIACPKSRQEIGGTWYTINYSKAKNGQFSIILPDGTLGHSVLEVGGKRIIT